MIKLINLLFIFLLTSCSSVIDFKQPGNRFYTPESMGKKKSEFNLHYAQGINTTIAEIYYGGIFSDKVSLDDRKSLDRSRGLGVGGRYGVHKRFDLELTKDHDTPFLFGIKYQAIGEPQEQLEEGVKLAFGLGFGVGSEDSSDKSEHSGEDREFNADADIFKTNLYTSVGHRFDELIITYVNLYYTSIKVESLIESKGGHFTTFERKDDLSSYGLNLGLRLDHNNAFANLEVGHQKVKMRGGENKDHFPIGLAIGFKTK